MPFSAYSWFEDQDRFATLSGVTKADRAATRLDQAIPNEDYIVQLEIVEPGPSGLGDFPTTGGRYPKLMSERAYEALADCLVPNGIVRCGELSNKRIFLFWPTTECDVLSYEQSQVHRSATGYERLNVPVFRQDVADPPPVFVTKHFPTLVFVTDTFVDVVRNHGLHGFCTWDDMGDDSSFRPIAPA